MKSSLKFAKILYIICSFLLCAVGILYIAGHSIATDILCYVIGGTLILCGIVKIIGYFSYDIYHLAFQFDLALGILVIIIGILFLVRSGSTVDSSNLHIGLFVLIDGVFKLQTATDAKKFGLGKWWIILLGSVFCIGSGGFLIFDLLDNRDIVNILIGVSLLIDGGQNLFNAYYTVKIIDRLHDKKEKNKIRFSKKS